MVKAIKRGAETIIQKGGIIRAFENLGFNQLPYRMKVKTETFSKGKLVFILNI